jgi:hypothetical protein
MTTDSWWNDPDTVWSVAAHGVETYALPDAEAVLHYFEKPWHYPELHTAWSTDSSALDVN